MRFIIGALTLTLALALAIELAKRANQGRALALALALAHYHRAHELAPVLVHVAAWRALPRGDLEPVHPDTWCP